MDKNILILIGSVIGVILAGFKFSAWSKAKLILDLMKARDQNEASRLKYDLEVIKKSIEDVDKQREDLKKRYEDESN